jgi:4-diphosphocytidyl-2-C-methyl-D-erythritol kinase
MGASLGSDVPFFLGNTDLSGCSGAAKGAARGAAWVSGRGEKVHPVAVPEPVYGLFWVLVNPGFPSDTAEAYRLLDKYRPKAPPFRHSSEILPFFAGPPGNWPFRNDFLPVFLASAENSPASDELSSVYPHIISHLQELGAEFAGLSGSGSSCFGVFTRQAGAELARESLLKHWPFVYISCATP